MERIKPFHLCEVFDDEYQYVRPSVKKQQALQRDETGRHDVLRLERISDNGKTTIGRLYFNGKFLCHTCEDTRRFYELSQHDPRWSPKVYGETCIAAGEYDLISRRHGGFFKRYIDRFNDIGHEGMIEIKDVLEFTDVLFHCGNTHRHTHGCVLVGTKRNDDFIAASGATYERIYPLIYPSVEAGNTKLIITDVERLVA
jgi:hypothetical protein